MCVCGDLEKPKTRWSRLYWGCNAIEKHVHAILARNFDAPDLPDRNCCVSPGVSAESFTICGSLGCYLSSSVQVSPADLQTVYLQQITRGAAILVHVVTTVLPLHELLYLSQIKAVEILTCCIISINYRHCSGIVRLFNDASRVALASRPARFILPCNTRANGRTLPSCCFRHIAGSSVTQPTAFTRR